MHSSSSRIKLYYSAESQHYMSVNLWHIGAGDGFREFLAEFEVVLIPLDDIALKDLLAYKI